MLVGDRHGVMQFFGFAQVFHIIKSIFDLLNTIYKNVSKNEQTRLPNPGRI